MVQDRLSVIEGGSMKTSVCLFAVLVSASSFAVELHALPQSGFADTEVSTNFVFAVGGGSNRSSVQ